ncbi:DUF5134 domain-containing protein [Phytoactinopolyspora limicola]|uniref:DUF5134 domain-containing protein n=1 Tax=Phytoactinopolyspora limicola TaxID=2715536 RepID=UPI00140978FD|nr:DUF5134 domain-containing protein [Phytoactinopolyspora limicola]
MEVGRWILIVLLTLAGVYALVQAGRSCRRRCGGRQLGGALVCHATHVTMAFGMAVMLSSHAHRVPVAVGVLTFGVLGVLIFASMVRGGITVRLPRPAEGEPLGPLAVHLLVGCAAMAYMYMTGHGVLGAHHASGAGGHHADHAVHVMFPPESAAWFLAYYFAAAALVAGIRLCTGDAVDPVRAAAATSAAPTSTVTTATVVTQARIRRPSSVTWARASDVVMSVSMTAMLVSSL